MDSPKFRENTGKNIKRIREEKGLTQAEVAKKAKLKSANYFAVIERGEVTTSPQNLVKISKVLGVDISELFK